MTTSPRLLLCDHRGAGLATRADGLRRAGFTVAVEESVSASLARLEREPFDLVALDPLVEGGARENAEIAQRAGPACARLLVCGPDAHAAALAVLRAETTQLFDVVRRDADADELTLRIERLLGLARERARLGELEHRASHDDRTDLLRPDVFERRIDELVSGAQRHHFDFALILVDLDDFGRVNKTWDHTTGDLVIAKVGETIRRNLRQEDVAGRLGGDEFGIVLPYTGKIDTAHAVRRLRDEIKRLTASLQARAPGIEVSASLGFETSDGTDIDSAALLRQHAEQALREAKRLGGGCAVYYRSLAAG